MWLLLLPTLEKDSGSKNSILILFYFVYYSAKFSALSEKPANIPIPQRNLCENQAKGQFYPFVINIVFEIKLETKHSIKSEAEVVPFRLRFNRSFVVWIKPNKCS